MKPITINGWQFFHDPEAEPGYKWLIEHSEKGEYYFSTFAEAVNYVRKEKGKSNG